MAACDHPAMSMARRRVMNLLVVASLALGGCQSIPGLGGLVGETPMACEAALLQGELTRTPEGGLGILMPGGPLYRVQWTSYLIGVGPPLELVDDNGLVVALEGDVVGVGGGEAGNEPLVWHECGGLVPTA